MPVPVSRGRTESSLENSLEFSRSTGYAPQDVRRGRDMVLSPQERQSSNTPPTVTPSTMTSSLESLEPTPRPIQRQIPSRPTTPSAYSHPRTNHNVPPRQQLNLQIQQHSSKRSMTPQQTVPIYTRPNHLRAQVSRTSLQPEQRSLVSPPGNGLDDHQHRSPIAYPIPSRAGAYLRHIASAPNIPRPSSTPVGSEHRKKASSKRTIVLNDTEDEWEDERPPMPKTWLETVAKAVLFGGIGARIGGPSTSHQSDLQYSSSSSSVTVTQRERSLRPTRSSLSQVSPQQRRAYRHQRDVRLSDRTNMMIEENTRPSFLAPPELFVRVGGRKANATTTEVSKAQVFCRSAPNSRSASRVRSSPTRDRRRQPETGGMLARIGRRTSLKGSSRSEPDRVPTLANTGVEGDDALPWFPRPIVATGAIDERGRYLSGWGADSATSRAGSRIEDKAMASRSDEDDDDDEDEPMDLARILVPPKRQNSIKSLRKHLTLVLQSGEDGVTRGRVRGKGPPSTSGLNNHDHLRAHSSPNTGKKASFEDRSYDGSEAGDCQWGRGWVRGGRGLGTPGRKDRSMGDEDGEPEVRMRLDEFHDDGYERGSSRFDSGKNLARTTSRRTGIPGGWGL